MWAAICSALASLFKIFIDKAMDKANEPTIAMDAPDVPKSVRSSWVDRVRKFKSRIRS